MLKLPPEGEAALEAIAQRYGVSTDAALTLLEALMRGNGRQAQFSHPELGGNGQWMQGGMTMVGDMFNQALKARVDGLCSELSALLANQVLMPTPAGTQSSVPSGQHQQQSTHSSPNSTGFHFSPFAPMTSASSWLQELGTPSSSGAQNGIRYAYFPATQRLAVESNGQITIYETLDHHITGVSQSQGGGSTLTFTSQKGDVRLADLPVVSHSGAVEAERGKPAPVMSTPAVAPHVSAPASSAPVVEAPHAPVAPSAATAGSMDIPALLERLAELKQKGILTEEEFTAKKADLLSRL